MQQITCTRHDMPSALAASIFADRGRQFVDRLKWNLCVTPQGLELDEYDDEHSVYLAVTSKNAHLGSCRVRPVRQSTMLMDHFLAQFPEAEDFLRMQRGRVWELTRFCRAPDIPVQRSAEMLDELAVLLDGFRDAHNLTGYVAVVFPQVARFLDTIGTRYLTVAKSRMDGKPVQLICITHCVRVDGKRPSAPQQRGKAPEQLAA